MPTTNDADKVDEQYAAHKLKGVDMFLHTLIWITISGFLIWSGMSALPAVAIGFVVTVVLAVMTKKA